MRCMLYIVALLLSTASLAQPLIDEKKGFALHQSVIAIDQNDDPLVKTAASLLSQDMQAVFGKSFPVQTESSPNSKFVILIGTVNGSNSIRQLIESGRLNTAAIENSWEAFQIQTLQPTQKNQPTVLVIAGSDRRGTAFGVMELSKQIGVSPWYWWADTPIRSRKKLFVPMNTLVTDAPQVKYRGIFINDEAPALSNWSKEKFGGFNHQFYDKVFELLLRLKSNYIWPAMWGNAFYADDSLNIRIAEKYGIVIGTSHHEPLMRAHDEWKRVGKGSWNYEENAENLRAFWTTGMQRASNEKIVSVGMRGDGDMPMSRETATALLEKIVSDQRTIIANVTGKPAEQTPQLWALYKEVQDYYDKGMRVPDDVTLLLCDDNWGNIRKLPHPSQPKRTGGYGIYYHFDYVGGPRNYKWINTNPLPRIWEQMHLAWKHDVKQIWIVNVGDIKPMEVPISFFLDYAWNPERIGPDQIQPYLVNWVAEQFGTTHATTIARLISQYAKYNGRRKPELLDQTTFSLASGEWNEVSTAYAKLLDTALTIQKELSPPQQHAYYQLVLHPIKAMTNLYNLYYQVALNHEAYSHRSNLTNSFATAAEKAYLNDSLITQEYHALNNGKWNHLMSQTHIGYTYWQQPRVQKMPTVYRLPADSTEEPPTRIQLRSKKAELPSNVVPPVFYEDEQKGVSIDASNYTHAVNANGFTWTVLPDHGRTGSAITAFPVTGSEQTITPGSPQLQYEIYTMSEGAVNINARFSPTLNFYGTEQGLQYGISIDDETPQIISINKEDKTSDRGIWNKWAAENIIIKQTQHQLQTPGKHTIRIWLVNPGVVLQKLELHARTPIKTYLGFPETIYQPNTK